MKKQTVKKHPAKDILGELLYKKDCFQGQREGEHVECVLIRHWIVLLPIFLVCLFGAFGILGVNALIREFIPNDADLLRKLSLTVDFFFITLILHYLFISFLNFFLKLVVITNLRIIDINFTTIFSRSMDALDLHNIQDINMQRRGFWRWVLNFGRIVMHNAAGTELFDFKYLKKPLKNYNIINHVHFKAMHDPEYIKRKQKQQSEENSNNPKYKITPKQTEWNDHDVH